MENLLQKQKEECEKIANLVIANFKFVFFRLEFFLKHRYCQPYLFQLAIGNYQIGNFFSEILGFIIILPSQRRPRNILCLRFSST